MNCCDQKFVNNFIDDSICHAVIPINSTYVLECLSRTINVKLLRHVVYFSLYFSTHCVFMAISLFVDLFLLTNENNSPSTISFLVSIWEKIFLCVSIRESNRTFTSPYIMKYISRKLRSYFSQHVQRQTTFNLDRKLFSVFCTLF